MTCILAKCLKTVFRALKTCYLSVSLSLCPSIYIYISMCAEVVQLCLACEKVKWINVFWSIIKNHWRTDEVKSFFASNNVRDLEALLVSGFFLIFFSALMVRSPAGTWRRSRWNKEIAQKKEKRASSQTHFYAIIKTLVSNLKLAQGLCSRTRSRLLSDWLQK